MLNIVWLKWMKYKSKNCINLQKCDKFTIFLYKSVIKAVIFLAKV